LNKNKQIWPKNAKSGEEIGERRFLGFFLVKCTKLKHNFLKQSQGFSDKNVSRQWLLLKLMK